jgi:Tfp pilus assembly protein PilX
MAVVLVVVMVLGLAVAGSIQPLAQEADLASMRVESMRAFFAAESGVTIAVGAVNAGLPPPRPGVRVTIGNQTVRFVSVEEDFAAVTVEGASGLAVRRVLLEFE